MNEIVEGKEVDDSVYLNGNELVIRSISIAKKDIHVVLSNEEQAVTVSGDWFSLRNDYGVTLEDQ